MVRRPGLKELAYRVRPAIAVIANTSSVTVVALIPAAMVFQLRSNA